MTTATATRWSDNRAQPTLRAVWRATLRSEWTKLRTVRSTIWALVFTVVSIVGLGAAITALEVSRWSQRSLTEIHGFDPVLYSFAGLNLAQLSIGVLGVLVMTSEYATGSITLTLGATPSRWLLLVAKVVVFGIVTAIVTGVSCVVAFFLCQALLGPEHSGISIATPGAARAVAGAVVHLVLVGVVAVALGTAMRRTAGAVALLFAVLLVVPGLVTLLPSPWNDTVTSYLPSSAGVAMSALVRFPNLLSPVGGFFLLVAYAAAAIALAGMLLTRRDA